MADEPKNMEHDLRWMKNYPRRKIKNCRFQFGGETFFHPALKDYTRIAIDELDKHRIMMIDEATGRNISMRTIGPERYERAFGGAFYGMTID